MSTSLARPRFGIVEGELLHDGVHRAALGGAEPATAPTRPIVGTWLLAIARVGGFVVVGVWLTATDRFTEALARRDDVVVGLVVVGEQRALYQADVGVRSGRVAEDLGDSTRRPDAAELAGRAIDLVGLVSGAVGQGIEVRPFVAGRVRHR